MTSNDMRMRVYTSGYRLLHDTEADGPIPWDKLPPNALGGEVQDNPPDDGA